MQPGRNILLVDDDPDMRETFADFLSDEGYFVETACDGVSALRALKTFPADLLLTDLNMPDMDGIELIRRARAVAGGVPAVLLTASPGDNPRGVMNAAGAAAFMIKPVAPENLLSVVHRILGAPRIHFASAPAAPAR